MSSVQKYPLIIRLLHWLIAPAMIGLIGLGWYMTGLGFYHPWYHSAPALHFSIGIIVAGLALLNLLGLFLRKSPPMDSHLRQWEILVASLTHKILLILTLLLPLSGFIITTAAGKPVTLFGLISIPALLPESDRLQLLSETLHYYLAYGGAVLIGLHVLAALKHHFINRDTTLRRML
jgi:cytochrome b561